MRAFILIFLLFMSRPLQASIKEIKNLHELLPHIEKISLAHDHEDVLVVFDIDNTLITASTTAGSDQWFDHLIQEKMKQGYSRKEAHDLALPTHLHALHFVKPKCVEEKTDSIVKEIQQMGFPSICLTARSFFIADLTIRQLKHHNMSFFFHRAPRDLAFDFDYPIIYKNGIIFCGPHKKEKGMMHFFDVVSYFPKVVVFIDDKIKYLEGMEKCLEESNIEFFGFRYAYCDKALSSFDADLAHQEWLTLVGEETIR